MISLNCSRQETTVEGMRVHIVTSKPILPTKDDVLVIGIDPGTAHLGLCFVSGQRMTGFEVSIPRRNDTKHRVTDVWNVLYQTSTIFGLEDFEPNNVFVGIEGAAFSKRFRQVELAEQRAAIISWFIPLGIESFYIVPPKRNDTIPDDIPINYSNMRSAVGVANYVLFTIKNKIPHVLGDLSESNETSQN